MNKIQTGVVGRIGIVSGGTLSVITPANIGGGPIIWLDASHNDYGNKTLLTTWEDRSGNGNDFGQTTESSKPFYRKDILNGRAVVCFDGYSNHMTLTANDITLGTQFVVCASNPNQDGNFSDFEGLGVCGATANTFFITDLNKKQLRAASQGVGTNVRINGTETVSMIDMNEPKIVTGFWDGSPPTPTNLVLCRDKNNGSRVWTGYVAEVILYETILTSTQISQVESYLSSKYNIELSS